MSDRALHPEDIRHLLRRLSFAATREQMRDLLGLNPSEAFKRIWSESWDGPLTDGPGVVALRSTDSAGEHDAQERQIRALREAWLGQMIASPAGLRENLLLLMHDLFGSSSATVAIPYALAARNRLLDAGDEPVLAPAASMAERRTGLVPTFDDAQFEAGPKTNLGSTANFDARSAVRHLALQPATARRIAGRLLQFFGVSEANGRLAGVLERTYIESEGSMRALLSTMVDAKEFWSEASRWSLLKSPVHLAVGACKQLALEPPLAALDQWLSACGQTLFETPNNGEGGWPHGEAWISPPDRLAIRYRLPGVLAGEALDLGLGPRPAAAHSEQLGALRISASIDDVFELLDPAPGVDAEAMRSAAGEDDAAALVRLVMSTPHYQLA